MRLSATAAAQLALALAAFPAAAQEAPCAPRGTEYAVVGDTTTVARVEPWEGAALVAAVRPAAAEGQWDFDVRTGVLFLRVVAGPVPSEPPARWFQVQVLGAVPEDRVRTIDIDLVALSTGDVGERTRVLRLLPECKGEGKP